MMVGFYHSPARDAIGGLFGRASFAKRNLMKHSDVIIIGLGPAGAAAAVDLAVAGASVLLLDGAGGAHKACGGSLSLRGMRALEAYDPPRWLYDYPVSTLWLSGPGHPAGRYPTDDPGAYFIERSKFDSFMSQKAAQAGAEIVRARARAVEKKGRSFRVVSDAGVFHTQWLLGADGANSLVGRGLGLCQSRNKFVALVEERPMPTHLADMLGDSALIELGGVRGGYGWLFGRGDTLNMGMAGKRGLLARSGGLKQCYRRFLARHGLSADGKPRGAVIPFPGQMRMARSRGKAAVIGDAAALADPFLGEGIAQAVVSGRMAAGAIIAGNMDRYEVMLTKTLLRDHRHSGLIGCLVYAQPGLALRLARRHPGGIDLGWMLLRGEIAPNNIWAGVARGALGLPHNLDPGASSYYSYPVS